MRRLLVALAAGLAVAAGCFGPDERDDDVSRAPPPDPAIFRPRDQFDEAFIRILEGQFEQALSRLERISTRPDRGKSYEDDVQFWTAYCLEEMGRLKEAREAYEAVVKGFPDSSYAPLAASLKDRIRHEAER